MRIADTPLNGWLLYKRHCQQLGITISEQYDLLKFTTTVSQSLLIDNKLPPSLSANRRGRPCRSQSTA
jgi:hypothetical protein